MRAFSLDALSGVAILTILIATYLPFSTHIFAVSWANMPFLLGLFCVGATIPFTFQAQLSQNFVENLLELTVKAGVIVLFALFLQHVKPDNWIYTYGKSKYIVPFVGFFTLFLMFGKIPKITGGAAQWVKMAGIVLAFFILCKVKYPDGSGFSIYKIDPFLGIVAWMTFLGSIIWLLTHNNWRLQLVILCVGVTLQFLVKTTFFLSIYPKIWIFQPYCLKYLLVTVLGVVAGNWLQSEKSQQNDVFLRNLGTFCSVLGLFLLWMDATVYFLGYTFLVAGIGFWGLFWFEKSINSPKKNYLTNLFIANGQQAMLLYMANACLISPFLIENPLLGFIKGIFTTVALAVITNSDTISQRDGIASNT
jgi:Domain of unknown function (DUF5009)